MTEDIMKQIKPGAKVRVWDTVGRFEGLVIARKHGKEAGATFTVRGVVAGVGVEKVYPVHMPTISKIEIVSSPNKIHRAKLYWVRDASSKKIRQKVGVSL